MNQKGFAVIETLLVIVILALIGGTGYYVWHSKKATNQALDTANKASSSQTAIPKQKTAPKSETSATNAATKNNDFVIHEWGIKIPNGTVETFTYSLHGSHAQLSTANLTAKDSDCAAANGPAVGAIQRATANEAVYEDGTTAAKAYQESPNTIAHIGSYYYVYTAPQAGCSQNRDTIDYENSIIPEIRALVPLAEADNQ